MRALPLIAVALFAVPASAKPAESIRHALLIGNADYETGRLKNPANDAVLLGGVLEELGFEVTVATDLDKRGMDTAIREFCYTVPKHSLALFYFAGHGVTVDRENYFVPLEASLEDELSVRYEAVSQSEIMDRLAASSSNLNVMVLDCCRNNPFTRQWLARQATRSIPFLHRGVARVAPSAIPEGTIVAYAAKENEVALDGQGENSPYAIQLAEALRRQPTQGLLLRDVFFDASKRVSDLTQKRQHPWLEIDPTMGDYFLRLPAELEAAAAADGGSAVSVSLGGSAAPLPLSAAPVPGAGLLPSIGVGPGPRPASGPLSNVRPMTRVVQNLMKQADTFRSTNQLDLAIEAYAAIVSMPGVPADVQQQARKKRGAIYLMRRDDRDLERALIDYQAAGEAGIRLSSVADGMELKIGENSTGKLFQDQVALVTKTNGEWFWVESVQGDSSIQGWVKPTAFVRTFDEAKKATKVETVQPTQVAKPVTSVGASGVSVITPSSSSSQGNVIVNGRPSSSGNPVMIQNTDGTWRRVNTSPGTSTRSNTTSGSSFNNGSFSNGQWRTVTPNSGSNSTVRRSGTTFQSDSRFSSSGSRMSTQPSQTNSNSAGSRLQRLIPRPPTPPTLTPPTPFSPPKFGPLQQLRGGFRR